MNYKKILNLYKNAPTLADKAKILAENNIISVPKDDNHNTYGEPLDHLDFEGQLPFGWVHYKRGFIEPRDKKLMDLHIKAKTAKHVTEEKRYIEDYLSYYQHYKSECETLGECYIKYFLDMYENIDNNYFISRLRYINDNIDELLKKEHLIKDIEEHVIPSLRKNIISIISHNQGVLQTDIYKKFDVNVKEYISSELYYMEKENIIVREKSGKTYRLYTK